MHPPPPHPPLFSFSKHDTLIIAKIRQRLCVLVSVCRCLLSTPSLTAKEASEVTAVKLGAEIRLNIKHISSPPKCHISNVYLHLYESTTPTHTHTRSGPLTAPELLSAAKYIFSKWRWVPGWPPNHFHLIIFGGKEETQTRIYLQFTARHHDSHEAAFKSHKPRNMHACLRVSQYLRETSADDVALAFLTGLSRVLISSWGTTASPREDSWTRLGRRGRRETREPVC